MALSLTDKLHLKLNIMLWFLLFSSYHQLYWN